MVCTWPCSMNFPILNHFGRHQGASKCVRAGGCLSFCYLHLLTPRSSRSSVSTSNPASLCCSENKFVLWIPPDALSALSLGPNKILRRKPLPLLTKLLYLPRLLPLFLTDTRGNRPGPADKSAGRRHRPPPPLPRIPIFRCAPRSTWTTSLTSYRPITAMKTTYPTCCETSGTWRADLSLVMIPRCITRLPWRWAGTSRFCPKAIRLTLTPIQKTSTMQTRACMLMKRKCYLLPHLPSRSGNFPPFPPRHDALRPLPITQSPP